MRIPAILLLLLGFALPALSNEHGPKSIKDLETEEFLLGGSIWEGIERAVQHKTIQCMRAFPHEEFCTCLVEEIPMVVNMVQYAVATTLSKEQMGYDKLSEDQRKAVDATTRARETCAARINQ